jgi:mono/diheme cytochrome c family protein
MSVFNPADRAKNTGLRPAKRALMLVAALSAAFVALEARAAPGSIDRGRQLAKANCAKCHAVAGEPRGPDVLAPPFRYLQQSNPQNNLDEVFARGVLVNHSAMPQFAAGPEDMDDLLAYLKSVQSVPDRP